MSDDRRRILGMNFSLYCLDERAQAAKRALSHLTQETEAAYERSCQRRKAEGIIPLAISGMGRAGKDTAAEYISRVTQNRVRYSGSASWRGMPYLAHMVGTTPEELYQIRHEHRDFMIAAFHALRADDIGFTARQALAQSDMIVGVRGMLELEFLSRTGMIDLSVWIDNSRVSPDKTVEYGAEDCDVVVHNHGARLDFFRRLHRLVRAVYPAQLRDAE